MSAYPFPQLWLGQDKFWLNKDLVQTLDGDFWIKNSASCSPGFSWHVADFGAFQVFANGTDVLVYTMDQGFQYFVEYQSEPVLFGTCCNFNGQLFVGNIIPFDGYYGFKGTWADAGADYVGWSKIGNVDMRLDKSNVAGHRPMVLGGVVQRVLQLGDTVIAYNSNGVQQYYPVSEHVVGFGMKPLAMPGCASRSAVGGNKTEHLMVDVTGQLWYLKNEQAPQLLGYEEFFRPMLGKDIVVTYCEAWKAFDITDGEIAYRLNSNGLSRHWQAITSQFTTLGDVIGTYHEVDSAGFELVTDVLDFGFRGQKTLTSIEVGGSFSGHVFASVDWRSHNEKYFRSTPWKLVSPQGMARIQVTADEFRVKLQSASKTSVEIDYIAVKYQITDRRNIRGSANVDSANTGANS